MHGKKTLPPDQLVLVYPDRRCRSSGLAAGVDGRARCCSGRMARIHAEKHLGTLIIEEPWVSEIHVLLHDPSF